MNLKTFSEENPGPDDGCIGEFCQKFKYELIPFSLQIISKKNGRNHFVTHSMRTEHRYQNLTKTSQETKTTLPNL